MIRAAIALGSNSTRMLCARLEPEGVVPLGRGRVETRLFMGLDSGGNLTVEAMARAAQAVDLLRQQALDLGCPPDQMDLYATSAVRDAANRDALAGLLLQKSGLEMLILSGEKEAELSFRAVSAGKRVLVLDIGGGSTELTYGEKDSILASVSLQMGASRCLKEHPIATAEDARALTALLEERMALEARAVAECRDSHGGSPLTAIGGTCTACQDMLLFNLRAFPDGSSLTYANTAFLRDLLAPMPVEERQRFRGLPPQRAMHIVHGLCILSAALAVFTPEKTEVSSLNNLDGWMDEIASQTFSHT